MNEYIPMNMWLKLFWIKSRMANILTASLQMKTCLFLKLKMRVLMRMPNMTPKGRVAFKTPWMKCSSGLLSQLLARLTEAWQGEYTLNSYPRMNEPKQIFIDSIRHIWLPLLYLDRNTCSFYIIYYFIIINVNSLFYIYYYSFSIYNIYYYLFYIIVITKGS